MNGKEASYYFSPGGEWGRLKDFWGYYMAFNGNGGGGDRRMKRGL